MNIKGTVAIGSTDCQCADCRAYRAEHAQQVSDEQAYDAFVRERVAQNKAARAYAEASKLNDEHQEYLSRGEQAVRDIKASFRGAF